MHVAVTFTYSCFINFSHLTRNKRTTVYATTLDVFNEGNNEYSFEPLGRSKRNRNTMANYHEHGNLFQAERFRH